MEHPHAESLKNGSWPAPCPSSTRDAGTSRCPLPGIKAAPGEAEILNDVTHNTICSCWEYVGLYVWQNRLSLDLLEHAYKPKPFAPATGC
jgi:hypothetical protein